MYACTSNKTQIDPYTMKHVFIVKMCCFAVDVVVFPFIFLPLAVAFHFFFYFIFIPFRSDVLACVTCRTRIRQSGSERATIGHNHFATSLFIISLSVQFVATDFHFYGSRVQQPQRSLRTRISSTNTIVENEKHNELFSCVD